MEQNGSELHFRFRCYRTLYGQAAAVSTRASEIAVELGSEVQRQTDAAIYAVHRAALQVAASVEQARPRPHIGARLAAAGPGHQTIALAETRWLTHSLAAHPDQGRYVARTGRLLGAIPGTVLWIAVFALLGMALLFPRMRAQHGAPGPLEIAALILRWYAGQLAARRAAERPHRLAGRRVV